MTTSFVIRSRDLATCPERIMLASHWNEDGTCMCPAATGERVEPVYRLRRELRLVDPGAHHYPVAAPYAETFWTRDLGPTALLLWRRLCTLEPGTVDVGAVCRELGVDSAGKAKGVLGRLSRFEFVHDTGSSLVVLTACRRLTWRRVSQFPERLALLHATWPAP